MCKVSLAIGLKNGQMISGIYQTEQTGSLDIAKEILPEKYEGESYISAIMSEDGKEHIFFRTEDVSVMKISTYQEKEQDDAP